MRFYLTVDVMKVNKREVGTQILDKMVLLLLTNEDILDTKDKTLGWMLRNGRGEQSR